MSTLERNSLYRPFCEIQTCDTKLTSLIGCLSAPKGYFSFIELYKLQNIQSFQKITALFRLPCVVKLYADPSCDQRKRKVVY